MDGHISTSLDRTVGAGVSVHTVSVKMVNLNRLDFGIIVSTDLDKMCIV